MSVLIKSELDSSIAFTTKNFTKIFKKAEQSLKINGKSNFNFEDWPYLVVDKDILEEEKIKNFISKKDKVGEMEVLFKRSFLSKLFPIYFPNYSGLRKFVIYDDVVCGVEIELKSR